MSTGMKLNAPKRTRSVAETFRVEEEIPAQAAKPVMLNIRVSSDFREAVKLWATAHNTSTTQVVLEALRAHTGLDFEDANVLSKAQVHAADILKVRAEK